jgi:prophage antirepressor-like protein
MDEVQIFNYESKEVRTVFKDGEPWWALKDVCDVLGITNSRMVAERLDDDEKGVSQTDTLGGTQELTIISESGLYDVIIRSDKPAAKPFRRWITREVLPSIRRTGSYVSPSSLPRRADWGGLSEAELNCVVEFIYNRLSEKTAERFAELGESLAEELTSAVSDLEMARIADVHEIVYHALKTERETYGKKSRKRKTAEEAENIFGTDENAGTLGEVLESRGL